MPVMDVPPMQVAQVVTERRAADAGNRGNRGLYPNSPNSANGKTGALTISHEPVASLGWPRMTMEFAAANSGLAARFKPGAKIRFEFVERGSGEWVVTKIDAK